MQPIIAIVGRPNVGKSTLFNCLTHSREALVADQPGLTRDRKYGKGNVAGRQFIVIDTGGLSGQAEDLDVLTADQVWQAVAEADYVIFIVDAKDGVVNGDHEIAQRLRENSKRITLVVNKVDGRNVDTAIADFNTLGIGSPHPTTASHGHGVSKVIESLFVDEDEIENESGEAYQGIKIAIIGKPNVGKSTLVNRMLGEDRVLAFDKPGTTRDSIFIPFKRNGKEYTLIDTAGVKRKGKVTDKVEKFSVIKALQAIERAHVVIMVIDAQQGVTDQDSHLLGFVLESGRALVIAVNKWDGLSDYQKQTVKQELNRKLKFIDYAKLHFISALHGTGVGNLYKPINRAYQSAIDAFATPLLTRILEDATSAHPPPLVKGRRIKLRYAHQGGKNPPIIIIHGNQTDKVPSNYQRYLSNIYRETLKLEGTPIRIAFKSGTNPYQGRKNKLTPHQISKKKRLKRYIKKKSK